MTIILQAPLLKKTSSAQHLEFEALVPGVRGMQVFKSGRKVEIELVSVFTAEPFHDRLNEIHCIDGCTNGVYSDGKNFWQLGFRRVIR